MLSDIIFDFLLPNFSVRKELTPEASASKRREVETSLSIPFPTGKLGMRGLL